jgi:electron transfer flavoprotein alpha subunit
VRRYLERNFKGLELTIAHRGAPGALARDAAETIRVEAALTGANLVLWQVGTADGMARIPPAEFKAELESTLDWLKSHGIDAMLVGLHYSDAMRKDEHYQQIREILRVVAQARGAPRIRRYEAAETLARMRGAAEEAPTPDCMADWLAQAVAVGLFGRRTPQEMTPPSSR